MNIIFIFDLIASLCFLFALVIIFFSKKKSIDNSSKSFIALAIGTYFLVGLSNILEHGNITDYFDLYEDYLEILFLPFFLFFIYSLLIRDELNKRIKVEATLKEREGLYRTLVENINLGITLIDKDYNILMTNPAQGRLFGKNYKETIGKKCFTEFSKNKKTACSNCPGIESMRTGKICITEKDAVRDDGSIIQIKVRTFPLLNNSKSPVGFIEVIEDLSDYKMMEEELIKSRKLESIGILAGGIAHDFNNLLTAVIGNLSLAKMNLKIDDPLYQQLSETENAAYKAKDLTQQLLTFSKGGAPIKKTTTISELIVDSTNFILHGTNIISKFNIRKDLWAIDADEGQISQVIYNLVTNSKEAMPDGGLLTVTAENIKDAHLSIPILKEGDYIKITVRDTGNGILPANIPKIFDPYFTTKGNGSGLGLATAYSIISKHGGYITAGSEKGNGSVFYIYLPVSDKEISANNGVSEKFHRGSGRIMVMDDDGSIRKVVKHMLTKLGYDVIAVKSGEEAIGKYRESLINKETIDIVILDLTVPGGMGGLDTIVELKKLNPHVKAIVSSGYSNDPVMSEYGKYGFCGVAPKPYRFEELSIILRKLLDMEKNE